jgi:hypothetical protein
MMMFAIASIIKKMMNPPILDIIILKTYLGISSGNLGEFKKVCSRKEKEVQPKEIRSSKEKGIWCIVIDRSH